MKKVTKPLKNQRGQGLIEYLIIVALIAVGTMAIMRTVGQSVNVKFAKIAEALGADVEGEIKTAKVTETQSSKKDMKDFMQGSK